MDLEKRLRLINNSIDKVGSDKVDLCLHLYETKSEVCWKETVYKSWKGFCNKEVPLAYSTVYVYLKTAKLAKDNDFRINDMKYIVSSIGWDRFRIGLSRIEKGESVNVLKFIKRFKDLNLNERVTYEDSESNLVDFTFSIPKSSAEVLTNELLTHGMRISNKNRSNMSSAMVKLIKECIKE